MTPQQADYLGRIADQLDRALCASKLRLPPHIHVEGLTATIREARDQIATTVKEATSTDPWADNPFQG